MTFIILYSMFVTPGFLFRFMEVFYFFCFVLNFNYFYFDLLKISVFVCLLWKVLCYDYDDYYYWNKKIIYEYANVIYLKN